MPLFLVLSPVAVPVSMDLAGKVLRGVSASALLPGGCGALGLLYTGAVKPNSPFDAPASPCTARVVAEGLGRPFPSRLLLLCLFRLEHQVSTDAFPMLGGDRWHAALGLRTAGGAQRRPEEEEVLQQEAANPAVIYAQDPRPMRAPRLRRRRLGEVEAGAARPWSGAAPAAETRAVQASDGAVAAPSCSPAAFGARGRMQWGR
jgi:hypothetical protein